MHIADALPNGAPPLKLRCQDKNHDLGDQTLNVSEEYKFKFKGGCGSLGAFLSECYWKVQEDGFYFGGRQDAQFEKRYSW
uniref:Uncharacterized protein n=1 Tax=Solanum tuberosum TaxID=4113 RepID=M1DTQ8_SOLTU